MRAENRPTQTQLTQAEKRHEDTTKQLIVTTDIRGVPGVSHTTTTVRDKDHPGLGGWRITTKDYLKKSLQRADGLYVAKVLGDPSLSFNHLPSAFESWKLSNEMWKKYANKANIVRTQMAANPQLFPQEMHDNQELWLAKTALVGGVKSVTEITDLNTFRRLTDKQLEDLAEQHAEHFDTLNNRTNHSVGYYTGPDMNSSSRLMTMMRDAGSPYATSYEGPGGSGDPSPVTARGVAYATRALVEFLGLSDDEVSVGIQGGGAVGYVLSKLLREDYPNGKIYIADTDDKRAKKVVKEFDAILIDPDKIHTAGVIFDPAATTGILTTETLSEMINAGVRGVAPAANAVYAAGKDQELSQYAHDNGITVVPAAHANLGGIFNIDREFAHEYNEPVPPQEVTYQAIAMMEPATKELLQEAKDSNKTPQEIFEINAHHEYTRLSIERGLIAA